MKQSEVYRQNEANAWFRRAGKNRYHHVEYILKLFDRETLSAFDVAEFGSSGGENLSLLKHYVKNVCGYDAGSEAIDNLIQNNISGRCCNLADENFLPASKYDLILLPMISMYIADDEFQQFVVNIEKSLNDHGYVYISDFLVRDQNIKENKHDPRIKIFKRNLVFYIEKFSQFDLIFFNVLNYDFSQDYKYQTSLMENKLAPNDDDWMFVSVFQKRLVD